MNQKFKKLKSTNDGFGLIEVVIGASIITVSLVAMVFIFQGVVSLSQSNLRGVQAAFLAEEGLEVMRFFRNESWSNLSDLDIGVDYALIFSSLDGWQIDEEPVLIDNLFDRRVRLEAVYRDGNNQIAPSGTLDSESYKVVTSVAWQNGQATTTKAITSYLTNILGQ